MNSFWKCWPKPGTALVVVAMVLASACSSGGGGTPTSNTTHSLLDKIHQSGQLRIGVASAEPFVYKDTATGEWTGVLVAPLQDWATQTLHVKLVTVPTTWDNMIAGLQANQYDIAVGVNWRPARALVVTYSDAVEYALDALAFYPSKTPISSWADVEQSKYSACVQSGSAEDLSVTNNPPKFQIVRLPDQNSCRLQLQSGRVNFMIDDWGAQGPFAKSNPGVKLIFPPTPFVNEAVAYATAKGYSFDDIQALNIQINSFIERGLMAQANKKFGVVSPLGFAVGDIPAYVQQAAAVAYPVGS